MDNETKERLKNLKFVVETDNYGRQMLWETNSKQGTKLTKYEISRTVDWVSESRGLIIEIGQLADMPLCISLSWAKINGQDVLFIDYVSMVCDHRVLNDWLQENCPNIIEKTDAMNFHNVVKGLQ